jgi:DNA polymerase elongation subunit (family B)
MLKHIDYGGTSANAVALFDGDRWRTDYSFYPRFYAKLDNPDHMFLRQWKHQGLVKEVNPVRKRIVWDTRRKLRKFLEIETYAPRVVPRLADQLSELEIPVFQADLRYLFTYLLATKQYLWEGIDKLKTVIFDPEWSKRDEVPFLIEGETGLFDLHTFQYDPIREFTFDGSARDNVQDFYRLVQQADLNVSHNLDGDWRVIHNYAQMARIPTIPMRTQKVFQGGSPFFGREWFIPAKIPSFDTMLATDLGIGRVVSHNLKYLNDHHDLRNGHERVYLNTRNIWKEYQLNPTRVKRYCRDDVLDCRNLMKYICSVPFTAAVRAGIPLDNVLFSGRKNVWEFLLCRECINQDMLIPQYQKVALRRERKFANPFLKYLDKYKEYKGGLTDKGLNAEYIYQVLKDVYHVDIISAYPSVCLEYNISPETVRKGTGTRAHHIKFKKGGTVSVIARRDIDGLLPAVLSPINDDVIALKQRRKEDPSLKPVYDGAKRLRDSQWASWSAKQGASRFLNSFSSGLTARICYEILGLMGKKMTELGTVVFHKHTDGLWIRALHGETHDQIRDYVQQVEDAVIEQYGARFGSMEGTGIDFDHYPYMYLIDKNDYVTLDEHGHMGIKGVKLRSRNYTRIERRGIREVLRVLFLEGTKAAKEKIKTIVNEIWHSDDPFDFIQNFYLKSAYKETSVHKLALLDKFGSGNHLVFVTGRPKRKPKPEKNYKLIEHFTPGEVSRAWYEWHFKTYICRSVLHLFEPRQQRLGAYF